MLVNSKFKSLLSLLLITSIFSALIVLEARAQDQGYKKIHDAPQDALFWAQPTFQNIDMSPTGHAIAVVRSNNDETNDVIIMTLGEDQKVETLELGEIVPIWTRWKSESTLLIAYQESKSIRLPFGMKVEEEDGSYSKNFTGLNQARLVAFDVNKKSVIATMFASGGKNIKENLNLASITSILADDPDHIIMPAKDGRTRLYKVNVKTGKHKEIAKGSLKTSGWLVNDAGVPVVRFDNDDSGEWVEILTTPPGEENWDRLAFIRREELSSFTPITQAEASHIFYVSARPEGRDKNAVYKYDLQSKTYLGLVSAHDIVDVQTAKLDENGDLFATVYFEDQISYDFVNKKNTKHYKAVRGFFDNEFNVYIEEISNDGNIWLLRVEGPRDPGSYYYYTKSTSSIDPLYQTNPRLPADKLGTVEKYNYTALDGTKLHGYITHPPKNTKGPAPLIVLPHGGPEARDYIRFDFFSQFFASKGYRVFQPNFRGGSGYGRAFAEAGYGEWGGLMQDDVTAGVQSLIKDGLGEIGHICIAGASYGGYTALMGAIKTPELYECAVSLNGVTDLIDMVEFDIKKFKGNDVLIEYLFKTFGHPREDQDRLIYNSPTRRVDDIQIPVLVVQGTQDTTVPLQQGELMRDALRTAGKEYEYHEFDMNHSLFNLEGDTRFERYEYMLETFQITEKFIGKHIMK